VLELRLSDAGREALAAGRAVITPIERRVLAAFSRDELTTLTTLLARWTTAFESD
jgi:hypothetical protein